jgi:hypothetical protein
LSFLPGVEDGLGARSVAYQRSRGSRSGVRQSVTWWFQGEADDSFGADHQSGAHAAQPLDLSGVLQRLVQIPQRGRECEETLLVD